MTKITQSAQYPKYSGSLWQIRCSSTNYQLSSIYHRIGFKNKRGFQNKNKIKLEVNLYQSNAQQKLSQYSQIHAEGTAEGSALKFLQ